MDFVAIVEAQGIYGMYWPVTGPVSSREECEKSLDEFMMAGGPDVVDWNTPTGSLTEEQEDAACREGYSVIAVLDLSKFPEADTFLGTATVIRDICQGS